MAAWGEGLKQLHLVVINSLITHSALAIPVVSLAHYQFEFGEATHMEYKNILFCDHSMVYASLEHTTSILCCIVYFKH